MNSSFGEWDLIIKWFCGSCSYKSSNYFKIMLTENNYFDVERGL